MSEKGAWRDLWEEIDAVIAVHEHRLAKEYSTFLKNIRLAVTVYAREVHPEGFDEYGQPREAVEAEG